MKDFLLDIVQHTQLGHVDKIKVVGSETETKVIAIDTSTAVHVVIEGKFVNPIPEFIGTCGMANLDKLSAILNIAEYQEDAKIRVESSKDGNPDSVHFENKNGDFTNYYRFVAANIINKLIEDFAFKGVKWGVEIEPTSASITRLKYQANINSNYETFKAKTENKNLKFYFGSPSDQSGTFVFAADVPGTVSKPWDWPTNMVCNILALPGDKVMKISDEGAMQIVVSSGLSTWNYIIPALSK